VVKVFRAGLLTCDKTCGAFPPQKRDSGKKLPWLSTAYSGGGRTGIKPVSQLKPQWLPKIRADFTLDRVCGKGFYDAMR